RLSVTAASLLATVHVFHVLLLAALIARFPANFFDVPHVADDSKELRRDVAFTPQTGGFGGKDELEFFRDRWGGE
ncbi:hypothetical protein BaRGS_00025641, partial [Batillaria attramentaria]